MARFGFALEFLNRPMRNFAPYTWQMALGVVLLVIILFVPQGLWSLVARRAA